MANLQPLEDIQSKIVKLVGRNVEVAKTTDGQYVAEWFCFGQPPPPKASDELTALMRFAEMLESSNVLKELQELDKLEESHNDDPKPPPAS